MKIVEFVEERQDEEEEEEEEEDVDSVDGGGDEGGKDAGPCRSSSSSSSRRTARRRKRKKKKKKKKQGMVMVGGDGNGGGGSSGNKVDAKRALVGAGARILFYPTLLYNVCRNKIQPEFRWWDEVDQYVLLGAVPFPKDVPRLKQLGVGGVITLNEPYETLVPSSLYRAYGIEHLVIPTRDYLFAPSFVDISRAVDFIHKNASCGRTTYVHCKAGRGRSTTIVLCYLVEYKQMTPTAALEFVRSKRPRVLLAPSQWKAVQEYSRRQAASATYSPSGDAVLITKADLEGYHSSCDDYDDDDGAIGKELAIVPRIKTRPVMARLSCLFASLKVSGGCGPVTTRLSEARAC